MEPEQADIQPLQPNNKKKLVIVGAIAVFLFASIASVAGLYFLVFDRSEPEKALEQEEVQTEEPARTTEDETAGWQTYRNEEYGFEVRYPVEWALSIQGDFYDTSRPVVLLVGFGDAVESCYAVGLGCVEQGGREELTKSFTLEGAPPLNPWFKSTKVKDDMWASIQMIDISFDCQTEELCRTHVAKAPFERKQIVNDPAYGKYNKFIDILSTFKFIEP